LVTWLLGYLVTWWRVALSIGYAEMIIAYNAFAKCIAATIIYFGDIL